MELLSKRIFKSDIQIVALLVLANLLILASSYFEYFSQSSIWSSVSLVEAGGWKAHLAVLWENMWVVFTAGICLGLYAFWSCRTWTLLPLSVVLILIQQRNLWVSDAGDKLLILLLIWLWVLSTSKTKWTKLFFMIQLAVIYMQNGFFKIEPAWFDEKNALALIWADPGISFQWASSLIALSSILSPIVPALELILPVFLFTRSRRKIAYLFLAYHFFILCTMNLTLFSAVMITWWIVFLSQDYSVDLERRFTKTDYFTGIWISVTLAQTVLIPLQLNFPKSVETFLSESYLKQKWSMFGKPWNHLSDLSFTCYRDGESVACPSQVEEWSKRESWGHRKLTIIDKMVWRNNSVALKRDFHRYLCSQIENVEELKISFIKKDQVRVLAAEDHSGKCHSKH